MSFKEQFIALVGNPIAKSALAAVNAALSAKTGQAYARAVYKAIAAAGDPARVSADNATRAAAVRLAGATFKARVAAAIDEYTEAQARREETRGTPDAAAALGDREREEDELEAVFSDPLGLRG